MGLISSQHALDLLLALTQRRAGARLAELARAAGASLSAAQVAAKVLVAEGVVERESCRRPRYRLQRDHPTTEPLVALAARTRSPDRALTTLVRANPAVEFAARDRDGLLLVESAIADPRDVVLLHDAMRLLRGAAEATSALTRFTHHELVEVLRDDPTPRRRAQRAAILKGSLERSFPSPDHHRGRTHSLPRPPRRALTRLARAHGLRSIRVFGSAARGRLRRGSDVDVLVEPRSGHSLSFLDLVRLEAGLEELFDRHVDVSTESGLRPQVRRRVAQEAVMVYG